MRLIPSSNAISPDPESLKTDDPSAQQLHVPSCVRNIKCSRRGAIRTAFSGYLVKAFGGSLKKIDWRKPVN
jgi:hypothetical protein